MKLKLLLGFTLIFYQNFSWFGMEGIGVVLLMIYMGTSTYITFISFKPLKI